MIAFYEDPALSRREEAPPTELAHAVSPANKGKGKLLAEQCDEQAKPIGDEFNFDFDPEEHEKIDSGTTHIDVRAEGGSRNITIPVNDDLLKNTEDVIQAFDPFCSDAKHQTLVKLSGSTLSKSIAGLTLRIQALVIADFRNEPCSRQRSLEVVLHDCSQALGVPFPDLSYYYLCVQTILYF